MLYFDLGVWNQQMTTAKVCLKLHLYAGIKWKEIAYGQENIYLLHNQRVESKITLKTICNLTQNDYELS